MRGPVIVEWTATAVRIAITEVSGPRVPLRDVRHAAIADGTSAAAALRPLVEELKLTGSLAIGVLPREAVLIRVVTFPSARAEEVARMVARYVNAQLPIAADDAVVTSAVVNRQPAATTVAVIACPHEVVARHLAIVEEAGLCPDGLTVSVWGVLGWYEHLAPTLATREPCLVVHVDEHRTDFVVIAEGRVWLSRGIGDGWREWTARSDSGEPLLLEMERCRTTLASCLPDLLIASIIVVGGREAARWSEAITQRLDVPVAVRAADQPVVVPGLASSGVQAPRLMPQALQIARQQRRRLDQAMRSGLIVAGTLLVGSLVLVAARYDERWKSDHAARQMSTLEQTTARLQERARVTRLVSSLLQERAGLATVLAGMFQQTPSEISLESISVDRSRKGVVVRGHADSTQTVLAYRKQLEALKGIRAASLHHTVLHTSPTGARTEFEMALTMS